MTKGWSERLYQALQELVTGLERQRIRYCVIGALAVGAWGQPRTTQDLDMLVVMEGQKGDHVLRVLQDQGFSFDTKWAEHNPLIRGQHTRLRWKGIPVDLILPIDDHDQFALKRRLRKRLGSMRLWVVSPEDLILHKLKAGRPRDFEDALSVIVRQGKRLDTVYLKRWGRRLGLHEDLAYLMER